MTISYSQSSARNKYRTRSSSDQVKFRHHSSSGRADPVATTTPRGLPAREPRSAPGSVFVDPRCRTICLRR